MRPRSAKIHPSRPRAAPRLAALFMAAAATGTAGCGSAGETPSTPYSAIHFEVQESGTDVLLQAVSAVNDSVAWISGHEGTWARTVDGGRTWETHVMPGGDSLQFRDVHALDAERAWLLSSGSGDRSRVYRTVDGGESWELQFVNPEPAGFYDCLEFRDAENGLLYGDAVDGELRILRTTDGGRRWELLRGKDLPAALPGEGGFAASGTCVELGSGGRAWIGTGAAPTPRVLVSGNEGRTWTAYPTPLAGGEAAGIFTVSFRDSLHGAILGGDLSRPDAYSDNVAVTTDGGATWTLAGRPAMPGAVYGASYVPGAPTPTLVALGPQGAEWSVDDGRTWVSADTTAWWGLDITSPGAGWAAGPEGRIARIHFE